MTSKVVDNPWSGQKGIPSRVTFQPLGYRDVMWCPYLNEPAILEWKHNKPDCPNCAGNFEPTTHPFICHIQKRSPIETSGVQWKDGLPYISGVLANYDQLVSLLRRAYPPMNQNLVARLKKGPAKSAGHPAEDVLDPLFYEAAEWIDRACALLPLISRAEGTPLAKEVSELLSQQPPTPDEEGNERLASYIKAYQKVSDMPAKQLVDLALQHLDGMPLQQLLVEELCSRVYPDWPKDNAGPLPRPCPHDDPSWCTAECERWRQQMRGSVRENPFDPAAIMGDPGHKRISMSFETLEQYEAALAFLEMADTSVAKISGIG